MKESHSIIVCFKKLLLSSLPYFKGSWFLYTKIFKLMPNEHRIFKIDDSLISLDLTDPPQFTMARLRKGITEPATTDFIKEHLKEGDIFMDIGANWGYFTCLASKIVGDDGLVVSIEPVKKTYWRLLDTMSRNWLFNVIAFNAALSDGHGDLVDFEKSWYRQSTSAFMKEGRKEGRKYQNPHWRLDCRKYKYRQ